MLRYRILSPALVAAVVVTAMIHAESAAAETGTPQTDYSRAVRPILSAKCFSCHGPDENRREADLRLDQQASVLSDREDYTAIVPGKPDESLLYQRIIATDADERMPPPDIGKPLTEAEILTLRRWIQEGATYTDHWAFVSPSRKSPSLPSVHQKDWPRGPIDHFILARLEQVGLQPSPGADPLTLLRRAYFDLVGLPPLPEEVDAFRREVEQSSLDTAYERLVDRLLASPEYGQRWARRWLDLARYADTNGYEKDRTRQIWAFRDWVIRALNDDLPFDRFTVAQIAGDMLPQTSAADRIATGFYRNSMLNEEGGIDPLEYRFYAMVDRVAATGTTWLGMTLHCCQCHSHKYDPISQQEYYQLMAFLNNADEPRMVLPDSNLKSRFQLNLARAEQLLEQLPDKWPLPELANETGPPADRPPEVRRRDLIQQRFDSWLAGQRLRAADWTPLRPVEATANLPILTVEEHETVFVSGDITKHDTYRLRFLPHMRGITAVRLEALPDDRLPNHGPGMTYYEGTPGDFFLGELQMTADGQPLTFRSASHSFTANQFGNSPGSAQLAFDGDLQTGWSVHGRQGERHVAVFVLDQPLESPRELSLTMDFGRHFACSLGRFRVSVTTAPAPQALDLPADAELLLIQPDSKLTDDERRRLWEEFLLAAPELADHAKEIRQLRKRPPSATTLVLRERPADEPRNTFVHRRGEFLQPLEQVSPATPTALHALPDDPPRDRLSFARWLVSPANPLTPRVVVNRHWAALFGAGIVRTTEDFGVQGAAPSHPDLLDWLALEFVEQDWSIKWLHRQMVLSATYRQSSVIRSNDLQVDPTNQWLARMSRRRLDAEMVRDAMLRSAGLLSTKMFGPGVHPPQPSGVTEVAYGSPAWPASEGENRYRRSVYTFVKRTAPFAAYQAFDAPSGESCVARRDVSNTPLQALTLLNDVMFTEATQSLGRALAKQNSDDDARVSWAFRSVLTRWPEPAEMQSLVEFVELQRRRFASGQLDPQPVAGVQEGDMVESASWTSLARVLLNLDEAINRN